MAKKKTPPSNEVPPRLDPSIFVLIERELFWRGRVSRKELMDAFGFSDSTASRALRAYRMTAPQNMLHSPGGRRAYFSTEEFVPVYYEPDYKDSGMPAQAIASELFQDDERNVHLAMMNIAKSRRAARSLRMTYTDRYGSVTKREITPLAWILIAGERPSILHAYCHLRKAHRSFELARMKNIAIGSVPDKPELFDNPEMENISIWIGERAFVVPQACVHPIVARAYSAASLRDIHMARDIEQAVLRAKTRPRTKKIP